MKVYEFLRKRPVDSLTIAVVFILIVLGVFSLFGTDIPFGWFLAAISFLASSVAFSNLQLEDDRRASRETISRIEMGVQSIQPDSGVREITPQRIQPELERLLDGATTWAFRGGSGTWQRSTVMPTLSGNPDRTVQYSLQVVDPFDVALCEQYELYRQRSRNPSRNTRALPPGEALRHEILACISAAAWHSINGRLEAKITLLRTFSPLRVDAAGGGAVITVADKSRAGLFAVNKEWYHTSMFDEIKQAELLGPSVDFRGAPGVERNFTGTNVKQFFTAVLLANPHLPADALSHFSSRDWSDIAKLVRP